MDNPNRKFRRITVLFGIMLIVSFIAYAGYNNKDKIKSWFENISGDDEPEETSSLQQIDNLSDLSAINQINQIFSSIPMIIMIVVIAIIIISLFRLFSNPLGDFKEIHSIKKA